MPVANKLFTPTTGRASAIKQVTPLVAQSQTVQQTTTQPTGLTSVSPPQVPKAPTPTSTAPLTFEQRLQQAYSQYNTATPNMPTYDATKQQAGIESMYGEQQKAMQERLAQQTATGVSALEQQRQKALPQYETLRGQTEVQAEQSRRAMAEQLGTQGLGASGQAVQRSATLEAGRVKSIADINTQQQQFVNDIDTQINQLKQQGLSEQNAQVAELNAKKQQALLDLEDKNYQYLTDIYKMQTDKQQKDLQNKVSAIESEYKMQQDKITQAFEQKKYTDLQKQQALENALKEKQFLFEKAISEAELNLKKQEMAQSYALASAKSSGSGGGGSSSSSGGGGGSSKLSAQEIKDMKGDLLFQLEREARETGKTMQSVVLKNSDAIKNSLGADFLNSAYGKSKTVDNQIATEIKNKAKAKEEKDLYGNKEKDKNTNTNTNTNGLTKAMDWLKNVFRSGSV